MLCMFCFFLVFFFFFLFFFFFFFFFSSRRRHTRCLSDWSSDVCSSDLVTFLPARAPVSKNSVSHAGSSGGPLTFVKIARLIPLSVPVDHVPPAKRSSLTP